MTSIIEKRLSLHRNLANQKQQNITLKSQLNHLQPLANTGTATCMIAHEINNLLLPLSAYAALALKNPDDKALTEKALQKIIKNCEHASGIMETILSVANGQQQQKQNTKLLALVQEIFTCLCRDFTKDKITVKIEIPKDLTVHAIPVQIQQVLMNLILNARDAMLGTGGILTIKAKEISDKVRIEVADTGCGIEPDNLDEIFEPFFTTKTRENGPSQNCGSGLGLAFCKKIIDEHQGIISVKSEPTRGTVFKINLPKN